MDRRDLGIAAALAALAGLLLLLVGCGSGSAGSDPTADAPRSAAVGHGAATRTCDGIVFDGPSPWDWRRDAASVGPFGLGGPGPGPDFRSGPFENDGILRVKTPLVVEGHQPVTVSVPARERDRAGLLSVDADREYRSITFVPCDDRPRTTFPAGIAVRDRNWVTLMVRAGDEEAQPLRVGRSPLREAVLRGARRDFESGTEAGPPRFGDCLVAGLRRELTRSELEVLTAVYRREDGQPFTAQSLNQLAIPVGARCGGRRFVPKLIAASEAFEGVRLDGYEATKVALEYGPFLGVSCRRPNRTGCDRVGIDLVLEREARSVRATVGDQAVDLRTPGPAPHDASAVGRDWGGYFSEVGLDRPGSPFAIRPNGRNHDQWGGYPPVYVPVRLSVTFADGSREAARLPRVFLSPGFG